MSLLFFVILQETEPRVFPLIIKEMFSDASEVVYAAVFDTRICEFYMKSMLGLM